ncbi:MAG: N-acetylmuramoyl-L-alanine amidase family protein [Clostridia bacterium]|nr:N-acetylmuramoyl-L-alanine amidase family protein [Clostridia bacterium]
MPGRWIKRAAAIILACCLVQGGAVTSMAATKPIKSVSVRVSSKLEAGSSLPNIEIGAGSPENGKVRVSGGNSKYHVSGAEWVDKAGDELKAADEPRMKVTLEPEDVGEDYFLASYKSSDVKVSGGTFVSARRDGDSLVVTLRVNGAKGEYDPPKDAFWNEKNLGEARWDKPENTSGYYELQLFRDGKSVYKVSKTSAVRYNFYPYMTKEGDYTFKVRTIPSTDIQVKYGKKSEWIESGELQVTDRYVSDGKGQQKKDSTLIRGTADTVGWIKEEDGWRYRYPDGGLIRGGWGQIDGQWYYFNMDGLMLTGWQNVDGRYYYLYPNGQMAVGWAKVDGRWYYFSPPGKMPGNPLAPWPGPAGR